MKYLLLTPFLLMPALSNAVDLRFGMVPKEQWSDFFLESKAGCEAAAKELGVQCVFEGPEKDDLRHQDAIISRMVKSGINGIAVAVTHSEYLSAHSIREAYSAGIPVVTYDSDFDERELAKQPEIRKAYIGTDNVELGRAAGRIAKKLRPNGGRFCIQSGRYDQANMQERILGLREELSGKQFAAPPGERVTSINGWTEVEDCPLYNLGNYDSALQQFKWALKLPTTEVDTFIAVGGWIQYKKEAYTAIVEAAEPMIKNNEKIIIVSDSEPLQLELLNAGLAHGNFGQSPYEMGRQAIHTLYNIHQGHPYSKVIHTPIPECTQESLSDCTQIK